MAVKDELGRRGEELAAQYLQELGLVVLDRNWRCREGEVDIVATDVRDTVVFCEVKTRSGVGFGTPAASVTLAKRRRLRRLSQLWLHQTGVRCALIRFDVVGIIWPPLGEPEIQYLADAF